MANWGGRRVKGIMKTMEKINIPQGIMTEIGFNDEVLPPYFTVIMKMNELLTAEQRCAVMEQEGCNKNKGGRYDTKSREFAHKHAGKSLAEKINELTKKGENLLLNDDGTLTARACNVDDKEGIFKVCHCLKEKYAEESKLFLNESSDKALMFSETFCGCCAGHWKHHLQIKLDVKLRLKSIGTSPDKTEKGHSRIFVYEPINNN